MSKFKSLTNAVLAQLNGTPTEKKDTLRDVMRGGADAGFSGFIYYNETVPFANKNRDLIVARLHEDVSNYGADSVVGMIKDWRTFKHYTPREIDAMWAEYLTGKDSEDVTLANALAWYALETVAHDVMDK